MASEKNAGEEQVQKKRRTRSVWFHLGLACLSGVVLYVVLICAAWVNLRESNPKQWYNQDRVARVFYSVQKIRESRKDHISSTEDLREAVHLDVLSQDAWGNEIQYEIDRDGELVVYSFGRDGKPGGTGLDADVYHDGRTHEETIPSFIEFYQPGMWTSSILSGGAYFCGVVSLILFIILYCSDSTPERPQHLAALVLCAIVTVGFAIAIGVVLLPLHVPSGH